jgi:hypothetical protein
MIENNLVKSLNLEDVIINEDTGFYGAYKVFSDYIGLSKIPKFFYGRFLHSWFPKELNVYPELIIGSFSRKNIRQYVDRKDQQDFLKKKGFKNIHSIGNPIIYTKKLEKVRVKNSLLIMPYHFHYLKNTSLDKTDNDYAIFLRKFIRKFDLVCLCLHSENYKNKKNYSKLRNLIPNIIQGANMYDINSYYRMARLFSLFEYVTSNEFGSHVAYASFFGCKVSVVGPNNKLSKKELLRHPGYNIKKNQPEITINSKIIDYWYSIYKKEMMFKWYCMFKCNPNDAKQNIKWGAEQLGYENKKTPNDLKELFCIDMTYKKLFVIFKEDKIIFIKGILIRLNLYNFFKYIFYLFK